jgi:hypothetical protein
MKGKQLKEYFEDLPGYEIIFSVSLLEEISLQPRFKISLGI